MTTQKLFKKKQPSSRDEDCQQHKHKIYLRAKTTRSSQKHFLLNSEKNLQATVNTREAHEREGKKCCSDKSD